MYKIFFVMRQDLEMSPAKLAVQIGHGTDLVHMAKNNSNYDIWLNKEISNRRKIILKVKTEEKLNNISELCKENNIRFDMIEDAGYTEFNSPTITGLVIHPIEDEKLPKQIRKLQLYV